MFDKEAGRLDEGLNKLAAELLETEAPPEVERAVLVEFDRVRRRGRGRQWIAALGAIAAAVVVVAVLAQDRFAPKTIVPAPAAVVASAPVSDAESDQPFMPIPYVLPPGPYERVEVVRMRMPVSALIAAGLPLRTADAGAQAEADVIVGQDGRPRAVRLVSISSFN